MNSKTISRAFCAGSLLAAVSAGLFYFRSVNAETAIIEPVQACVIKPDMEDNDYNRALFARCLNWQPNAAVPVCRGNYTEISIPPLDEDEIRLQADNVSFYREGRSTLSGDVTVQQNERIVNAQTAYVYRDDKTNEITHVELLGNVRYLEPGRLMVARKVTINMQDKSGKAEDVIYRFNTRKQGSILPAWGRASLIERFANKDYFLNKATYSTCAPQDRAWEIRAEKITLDDSEKMGVARNAQLLIRRVPVLYTPYLSFPTSKDRKSGFLIPTKGYSNVGGFDFSLPYYWNMAPNYDATIIPHLYTRRGLMMGGQFRYLTENSSGNINGRFLPHDRAYADFLHDNQLDFPELRGLSKDRWSMQFFDLTRINPNLNLRINYQQVSDDYYLQDFSSNLAVLTERQLLREGELDYTTEHWLFRGLLQSYQTLQPINESRIADIYQRLPQLMAHGVYEDLPFNGNLSLHGQFDNFDWPNSLYYQPEGPRYHFNPILSFPQLRPWGYITPNIELVENYYDVRRYYSDINRDFNNTTPRYYLDSGLYFDRSSSLFGQAFNQTLEPRLFYLYVPFHNQTEIPVYDSAYTIFNADQLFRTNRFSGYDRIGDTNQLSYAVTSRFLSDETGAEKASFTIGQSHYFANRRVQLCQSPTGYCKDVPYTLGYLSPTTDYSPIASRALYRLNPSWVVTGDYVWDPHTRSTDNGNINFHYQPEVNKIITLGYTYLVNGDIVELSEIPLQKNALHQASASFAWPINDAWSTLGAFSYNISKRYDMMTFMGIQYDNCCWAVRLVGGRAFKSLSQAARPQYNDNVYLQLLLKGLGSVGNSDPATIIHTYIPGYRDSFHRY
ncbi:LPS-assembly protein LptD [Legionella sp. 16cNR16C]|uniref:LPS-assembly protein LptD n=1 Tax=Legionella sp. 16cNR16C TaxID=2905656 RepID=UPI001E3FC849|nr:LPS-assembly protein LptD [Legionella sp. 16cNR16C]MCE3045551.1 LPS-assembly protein LptD [Legionella sp. 16cNR16C]